MPTPAQKLTVALAFVAAALSFLAAGFRFVRDGAVDWTPVLGGLLMLALGVGGYVRLKSG